LLRDLLLLLLLEEPKVVESARLARAEFPAPDLLLSFSSMLC
jgi:hypothetical protein